MYRYFKSFGIKIPQSCRTWKEKERVNGQGKSDNDQVYTFFPQDLGVGDFIPLSANHYEICKPCSRWVPAYVKTVDFVKQYVDTIDVEDFMPIPLF